ncbi:MAG: 2-hydroxyglutaryl-CoA dehydratase, partial [Chloroflexi bacterium]|nr:2-hydroxyglutaryl-CoA dehydratase [Chloroflexota bacterium]
MITAGIDIGSITAKCALLSDGKIVGTRVIFTGYNSENAGRMVFLELLAEKGIDEASVSRVISTGYGRANVGFADKAVTEITCHGAGAHFLNPAV